MGNAFVRIVQGDITEQDTEAIVNAANSSLMGGGGVDGAIHSRGGPAILAECRQLRKNAWPDGLPPGEAALTGGGRLKARYVIHTVGPIWRGGRSKEDEILRRCYANSLRLAGERAISAVSFPSISTGAYGYPIELASPVAMSSVARFLKAGGTVREVRFVLFSADDLGEYLERAPVCLESTE